jgi:hypothetical protein
MAVLAAWALQKVQFVACRECFPLPPAGSLKDKLSLYLILSEARASFPGLLSGLILHCTHLSFPDHLGHPIINSYLPPSLRSPVSSIPHADLSRGCQESQNMSGTMCQRVWQIITVGLAASQGQVLSTCTQNHCFRVRLMTGLLGKLNALL